MKEVLEKHRVKIDASKVLEKLNLAIGKYIIVSAHREENIDNERNFMSLMFALNSIAERYQMPVVYSTHPRSAKYIEQRKFKFNRLVQNLEPFAFTDYIKLQKNSYCVLSDSGTLSEESSILGFPAVLIRTSTERPEVLDKGTIAIGGINGDDILQSIELVQEMSKNNDFGEVALDYSDDNVSTKVVKIIQSYTKIINHVIWQK
jgi:UDP-N-acetylglucosamine 2-epimerase (non-hydrolysing)